MRHAVLLERRHGEDALPHLLVAHGDVPPLRFNHRSALVEHLLQELLVDAKLLQQRLGHLAAVGRPIRLELRLIRAPELLALDFVPFDDGDLVGGGEIGARVSEKVRNVEDDKCEADEREAPLEPVSMPPHPIEHGHGVRCPFESSCEPPMVRHELALWQAVTGCRMVYSPVSKYLAAWPEGVV